MKKSKNKEIRVEILTIGTEITLGFSVDTNSSLLSRELAKIGFFPVRHTSCPDDRSEITSFIKGALKRSRKLILLTTGGLGPTLDDLTREALSEVTQRKLVFHPEIAELLRKKFRYFSQEMPDLVIRQAYVPEGAIIIKPKEGTAPGLILDEKGKVIISLPGVPSEIKEMLPQVISYLEDKKRRSLGVTLSRIIKTAGLSEAEVEEKVEDIMKETRDLKIGILAHPESVDLELIVECSSQAEAKRLIAQKEKEIKERLGNFIFGYDQDTLEKKIGEILKKKKLTLAVAESCTAGLLGERITKISGSSNYFLGGVIAYSNELKKKLLGVSEKALIEKGAVSFEVAEAMAKGVQELTGASVGLSITGIAGPKGGTKEKPVGLVYIGLSTEKESKVKKFIFSGNRDLVRFKATQEALNLLRFTLIDG